MAGGMRDLFDDGGNWIAGGVAAAVLLPALVFGLGLPLLVGLVVAGIAFAGVTILTAPRGLFEGIDVSKAGQGRVELARKVLTEAIPYRDRLKAAAINQSDKEVGTRLRQMADTTDAIMDEVEKNPEKLTLVTRFLGYYLPQAAEVADGYNMVQGKRIPDQKRAGEMRDMIGKLGTAFSKFSDSLVDADLKGIDVELKLLEATLKDDMGTPS
jgi:5-bromo-4-chloroindolyl phosphate hydrolysis protein